MFNSFKKNLLILIAFCFAYFAFVPISYAVTYSSSSTCYYFNRSTGAYSTSKVSSSYGRDCVKTIDDEEAYCAQWTVAQSSSSLVYEQDTSWSTSSKKAILAGIIMEIVSEQYSGTQAYGITAAALNTFSAKYLSDSKSYNFYSTNSTIKSIYDEAIETYSNYTTSKSLPTLTLSVDSSTLNYSSSVFISDKITLSGLVALYGNDDVTYTVSATNGQICSSASGTGCQSSVTLNNRSNDYSFYVKANSGVTSSDEVVVTVKGSNSSTYPSSIRYQVSSGGTGQLLLVKTSYKVSRSTSKSLVLSVPDTTYHKLVAYKVDESGNLLKGASLSIYKDNTTSSGNLLASNSNGSYIVSYTSPTVSTEDDDFFSHDYYLVETSAPDGYILNSTVNHFYISGSSSSSSSTSTCYYNGGSESDEVTVADSERCNFSAYTYMCKNESDGSITDLSEEGNCSFSSTSTDADSGEVTTTTTTLTTICYNTTTSSEVEDTTYCSDKDYYTKVVKSSGNIVVTQVNKMNSIKISKMDINGSEEVAGATLKICSSDTYSSDGTNCTAATTVADVELSWTSGTSAREFSGLKAGTYYLIEVTAPYGYSKATTVVEFSIDETGVVTSNGKEVTDNWLVINDELTSITVSKQDVATSSELPGATLSICVTYTDEYGDIQMSTDQYTGDCVAAILQDGTTATWVSTDSPHVVSGLNPGTYYLVETTAPDGYSTSESIMFVLNEDGTLTDADGNSLADNKLVMYDSEITEVETGMLKLFTVIGIVFVAAIIGGGGYYYYNKKNNNGKFEFKLFKRKDS